MSLTPDLKHLIVFTRQQEHEEYGRHQFTYFIGAGGTYFCDLFNFSALKVRTLCCTESILVAKSAHRHLSITRNVAEALSWWHYIQEESVRLTWAWCSRLVHEIFCRYALTYFDLRLPFRHMVRHSWLQISFMDAGSHRSRSSKTASDGSTLIAGKTSIPGQFAPRQSRRGVPGPQQITWKRNQPKASSAP